MEINNMRRFCELTSWWNTHYIQNQISPHFFYYPAELMLRKGFDVEVLTKLYPERNEIEYEINNGINVRRFPQNSVKFCESLLGYMLKKDYSLIHLHTIGFLEDYIPWVVSRIRKTPIIFTSHSSGLPDYENRSDMRAKIFKKCLKIRESETSIFIAFTQFQANLYKKFGIKNIRVIPHGIDPTVFKTNRSLNVSEKYGFDDNNILYVGQIDPRKGQHILVESMPGILKVYPKTKLFLVGRALEDFQKEYKKMLEMNIEKMGLAKNIAFLDDVPKDELIQLYLLSDIFAFPTNAELSPLVLLEAMAAGLTIVATDRPYIREILQNGDAGLLVRREKKEFETGILKLLDDKNLRKRLSENGRRSIEKKYLLDNIVRSHWDLYRSLIEG